MSDLRTGEFGSSYSQHALRGAMLQQQPGDGRVSVPGGVMQRRVVLVARRVEQSPAGQQHLHQRQVAQVARLVLEHTHTKTVSQRCHGVAVKQSAWLHWGVEENAFALFDTFFFSLDILKKSMMLFHFQYGSFHFESTQIIFFLFFGQGRRDHFPHEIVKVRSPYLTY